MRSSNCAALQRNSSGKRGRIQAVAHLEVRVRGGPRKLVPRAHELAVVAAVDAVADGGAQLGGIAPWCSMVR